MESISNKLVLVGARCIKDAALRTEVKKLSSLFEICYSDTGIEYAGYIEEGQYTIFVYDDFTDEIFAKLCSKHGSIISPHIIYTAIQTDPPVLAPRKRPLYNHSLKDQVICFTGFTERVQISHLASLVHYMDGTIRKDYNPNVTHVVANHCKGEKYKRAVSLGRPIMQHDWLYQLWERRDNSDITGNSPEMMQFKAPPFLKCGIAFHGFLESDVRDMEEMTMNNGGQLCQTDDAECTHVVVDNVNTLPSDVNSSIAVVKAEWFWASVQMGVCADERVYRVTPEGDENATLRLTPSKSRYSLNRSKKRKRHLRENLAAIANEGELTPGGSGYKSRRSSTDQLSASFMSADITPNSSACLLDSPSPGQPLSPTPEKALAPPTGKPSAKKLVVGELLQTERNYCGILSNVLSIFRDGAENTDQPGGAILSNTDSKIIFGGIPPILDVHQEIREDLELLLENWSDDVSVANVILSKVEKLKHAYPPFVNYFEKTKEKINACIKSDHRFYAFMKVCQRRKECGRQSLPDLLMNVVQRLPRIELLLQQIHKYSDKKSSDYKMLEQAQSELKSVTRHINEDKRIADERMVLFEIMNDIEHCPPNLLSASRNFVSRIDVSEVSDDLVGKGEYLTLFLFTDSLEVVKRRHKASSTPFKSPAANKMGSLPSSSKSKPFKHVELLPLPSIKRILNVTLNDDAETSVGGNCAGSSAIFSLVCRKVTDTREALHTFQVPESDIVDKTEFMNILAGNIAKCCCRTDFDTFITTRAASELMITPLDLQNNNKTMTKAVSKFGKRLSRAMTMKGVASPLKRAVSTMLTPTRRSSLKRSDLSSMSSASSSMWELDASMSSTATTSTLDDTSFLSTASNLSPNTKQSNRRRSFIGRVKDRLKGKVNVRSPTSAGRMASSSPIASRTRRQSVWSVQDTISEVVSPITSSDMSEHAPERNCGKLTSDEKLAQSTPKHASIAPGRGNLLIENSVELSPYPFVVPKMPLTPILSTRKRRSTVHLLKTFLPSTKKVKVRKVSGYNNTSSSLSLLNSDTVQDNSSNFQVTTVVDSCKGPVDSCKGPVDSYKGPVDSSTPTVSASQSPVDLSSNMFSSNCNATILQHNSLNVTDGTPTSSADVNTNSHTIG